MGRKELTVSFITALIRTECIYKPGRHGVNTVPADDVISEMMANTRANYELALIKSS